MGASSTLRAAIFVVSGMVLMGFIDNFVKVIAEDIGLWQFHASRSALVLALLVPFALWRGWVIRPKRVWAVALRSFCVATAMILYFGALTLLPIAQVGAGLFTSPIFVLLLTVLLTRARIGFWRMLAVALGFAGVLLLLRPDADGLTWFSAIPVLAGLFYAAGALCTRTLCAEESTVTLLSGFFAVLGLWGLAGLAMLWGAETTPTADGFFGTGWQSWTGQALFWTVAQGLVSLVAIGCITRAYLIAEASYVAVFEYTFLISAGFWAYVLWQEVPAPSGFMGIALIVAAGVVIILRSRTEDQPA